MQDAVKHQNVSLSREMEKLLFYVLSTKVEVMLEVYLQLFRLGQLLQTPHTKIWYLKWSAKGVFLIQVLYYLQDYL